MDRVKKLKMVKNDTEKNMECEKQEKKSTEPTM